ncbi:MAG: type II secretion system GspH family protein [Lentisphaeraceae bacterium]|nr:type II secretion system GspH family protein [Lentisphaeraceae bacterium]
MKRFTLIELLVVIAVLGILISFLLPSLKKAQEATKKAVCASNEKQIYVVLLDYIFEKNNNSYNTNWARANKKAAGQLPYYRFWEIFALENKTNAEKFFKQIACPLVEKPNNVDTENPYSITRHVQLRWFQSFDTPSETILLGEKRTDISLPISTRFREETDDRHFINKAKSNVLLIDGHVESGNYHEFVDMTSGPHF